MLKRIATGLWGKFDSSQELKKFIKLAVIFFLLIGIYWTLRPIKDSMFGSIVGGKSLPMAKILSILVIAPLVVIYIKLIEKFAREKVFYGLLSVYILCTLFFTFAFMNPIVEASLLSGVPVEGSWRMVGWLWYVFIESFGSLMIALFWIIVTDITLPDSAKRGFPIIALFGQLGNIFGPFLLNTSMLGVATSAPIVAICAGLMVLTLILMRNFMNTTPIELLTGYHEADKVNTKKKEAGFLEGLQLLLREKYLLGIFFIVGVYEVIVTVMDNHFKQTVYEVHTTEAARAAYLSGYATWVGIIASLCVLFGINNIQRYLGMKPSLFLLPILIGIAMISMAFNPLSLNIAFCIMVLAKAVNYALNQPTLKLLYIPTTQDSRHKSQGWIEMFGSRASKGFASVFNLSRTSLGAQSFLIGACFVSFGFIAVWFWVAIFVSKKYNTAIARNEVVC